MPMLTADAAFASALTIGDRQELAARDPEFVVRELLQCLQALLSPERRRLCFVNVSEPEALLESLRRAKSLLRAEAPCGCALHVEGSLSCGGQPVRAGARFPFDLVAVREQSGRRDAVPLCARVSSKMI